MRKFGGALVAVTAIAVLVAGCSSSKKSDGGGSGNSGGATGATSSAAAAAGLTADQLKWALDFTKGTKGKADSTKSPVVVGYVNQQGGTLSFPSATVAQDAMVKFVNEQLGGIDGHPLVLHKCLAAAPEDSQKCGQQMANDSDVKSIMIPLLLLNNQAFYQPIGGKKPILAGGLIFPIDLTTPNVYSYQPGLFAGATGLAKFAVQNLKVKRVIVIRTDNPAGLAAAQFYETQIKAAGATTVDVPVPEPGTAPVYTAALKAANPQPGDAIDLAITAIGAASVYDAMKTLNVPASIPVLAGASHGLPPMPGHLKDLGVKDTVFPDGWYIQDPGYSELMNVPNSNGVDVYNAIMDQYTPAGSDRSSYASYTFQQTMSFVRFYNENGGASATSEQIGNAIKTFTGPAPLDAGPLRCGAIKETPNLCQFSIGYEQRKNGQWVSVADGLNGKAIDTLAP